MKRLNAHTHPDARAHTHTHTPTRAHAHTHRMAWTEKVSERRARVPGECFSANRYQGNGRPSSSRSKQQGQSVFPGLRGETGRLHTCSCLGASARPGGPAAGSQLLAAAPSSTRPPGRSPSQGKFNWVPWQPKCTRTPQGVVEKSEFDMLGNI